MKSILILILTAFNITASAQYHITQVADASYPWDTMQVYIPAGQSNAGGRASVASFTGNYAGTIGANGKVAFIKNSVLNPGTFDTLVAGVNSSDVFAYGGIQPVLGYELVNYKRRDIYFMQAALGGQSINTWASASTQGAWLDSSIVTMRRKADAMGKKFVFKGFIWFQGESDGGDGSGIYQGKLEALIARVRLLTGVSTLPTVIVQMCDCQTGVPNLALLQATQATVAAQTNNYLISKSIGNTCQDILHFNYAGQYDKAIAIFNIIKDF